MFHSRRISHQLVSRVILSSKGNVKIAMKSFPASHQVMSVRSFSDVPSNGEAGKPIASVVDSVQAAVDAQVVDAASAVVTSEGPGWAAGKIMESIEWIHTTFDMPYWGAIIAATVAVRLIILPVAIKTVQGSARMANMRPEMQKIQDQMNKDPNIDQMAVKLRYQNEIKNLFTKYKVNPLRAVMWPFAQFPIFIAFFMALKEMGMYYPGLATGGAFWFENLAIADPYYALPLINAASFLIMIEIGQDGVQMENQATFKKIMRGLAVVMVPATAMMPQALFIYWGANNFISIFQTKILKMDSVRTMLDIPKPPAPENTPVLKIKSPIQSIKEAFAAERAAREDAKAEIINGEKRPKAPAGPPPKTFDAPPKTAVGPPPKTFEAPPKKK